MTPLPELRLGNALFKPTDPEARVITDAASSLGIEPEEFCNLNGFTDQAYAAIEDNQSTAEVSRLMHLYLRITNLDIQGEYSPLQLANRPDRFTIMELFGYEYKFSGQQAEGATLEKVNNMTIAKGLETLKRPWVVFRERNGDCDDFAVYVAQQLMGQAETILGHYYHDKKIELVVGGMKRADGTYGYHGWLEVDDLIIECSNPTKIDAIRKDSEAAAKYVEAENDDSRR
ncbi:MAG: hypothetical protein ABIE84_01845, partial [bacterium]